MILKYLYVKITYMERSRQGGLAQRILNRGWSGVSNFQDIYRAAHLIHERVKGHDDSLRVRIAASIPFAMALIGASKFEGSRLVGNAFLSETCCTDDDGFSSHLPGGGNKIIPSSAIS